MKIGRWIFNSTELKSLTCEKEILPAAKLKCSARKVNISLKSLCKGLFIGIGIGIGVGIAIGIEIETK